MPPRYGQLIQYVRPDGTVTNLHSLPTRAVRGMSGWGMPPMSIHKITGPFQHGASVLGYRFQPRTINMELIKKGCSRSGWFTERSFLIDRMGIQRTNPNLPELGRLQWLYIEDETHKKRALDVYLNRGLTYNSAPHWFEWGILEQLEFIAEDPIIYDPTQVTVTIDTFEEELILPMTFPFILGAVTALQNITYTGTWPEFPIIEVDGPANGVYIENQTLGIAIQLDYLIAPGDTVTFNLTSGAKTVTNSAGDNLIEYINNPATNLAQFVIEKAPEAVGGVNTFFVALSDTDTTTEVRIKYYNRYVGI